MQPAGVQQGCARVGQAGTGGIRKRRGSPTPLQKTLLACVFQAGERVLASPDGGADTLRRGGVQPPLQCRVWLHRPRNPGPSDRRGRTDCLVCAQVCCRLRFCEDHGRLTRFLGTVGVCYGGVIILILIPNLFWEP